MKKKMILLTVIVLLIFFAYQYLTIKKQKSSKQSISQNNLVKVITQTTWSTSNSQVFRTIGTGQARLSVEIYPKVAGEVVAVNFQAEEQVKKNQVLIKLDDRNEQLALKIAEVQVKDAKTRLARYDAAYKEGTVPITDYDAAETALESAQLAVKQAQLAIEDKTIVAPFTGMVGIPNVDPGDRVSENTLITGLDDRDVLFVDFEIPERLVAALNEAEAKHQKITALTPAYPEKTFAGYIAARETRIDPARRTLKARAMINNQNDLLRPGMSFETIWEITGKEYPTISEIALQWSKTGAFIWRINNHVAEKISVNIIARQASAVLLEGDINVGDQIVIEGLQRMRPNLNVEIIGNTGE